MILHSLDKYRDFGLLILRIGIGAMFMYHGFGKMSGGPEMWGKVGGALSFLGITAGATFFGFMAAFSELVGGFLLMVGFLFRPACFLLVVTMFVASVMHLAKGDGLPVASHAIEAGILFFSLIFIGPGNFSVDGKL